MEQDVYRELVSLMEKYADLKAKTAIIRRIVEEDLSSEYVTNEMKSIAMVLGIEVEKKD